MIDDSSLVVSSMAALARMGSYRGPSYKRLDAFARRRVRPGREVYRPGHNLHYFSSVERGLSD